MCDTSPMSRLYLAGCTAADVVLLSIFYLCDQLCLHPFCYVAATVQYERKLLIERERKRQEAAAEHAGEKHH